MQRGCAVDALRGVPGRYWETGACRVTATQLFRRASRSFPPEVIANTLGLHHNTVQRWGDLGYVPEHYEGDFQRLLGGKAKTVDQFYTRPAVARQCYRTFLQVARELEVNLRRYRFIEPAAGCGWFYRALPPTRRIGVDLAPRLDRTIIRADYLRWAPSPGPGKYIVIGNPPFGLRGHLALQFINHSGEFADMVAFILPQLFESDGKGAPGKRVRGDFKLAHTERLPAASFEKPDGEPVDVSTVFQVWTRVKQENIRLRPRKSCKSFIKVYSLSNGGTPSSTRNKAMIGKCDIYLPSTCFSGMKAYRNFRELPHRRGYGVVIHQSKREIKRLLLSHNWEATAFPSTNGALNLRNSLIEDVVSRWGFHDAAP